MNVLKVIVTLKRLPYLKCREFFIFPQILQLCSSLPVISGVKTFCKSSAMRTVSLFECNTLINMSLNASPYFCHFPTNIALCIPYERLNNNLNLPELTSVLIPVMAHKTHA